MIGEQLRHVSVLSRLLPKQHVLSVSVLRMPSILPYQFELDSDSETIELENRAEPLHAQILQDILDW